MTRSSHFLAIKPPRVRAGEKIGLMGGSFNPPHEGHLAVAETALRRGALDRIWWMVSPANPLKEHSELAPLVERVAAARRLARHPRMEVTSFEKDLGCAYTYETVAFLTRRFPSARFVWVMGGDSLASFHRWRNWRAIAGMVPLLVVDRPGWRFKALSSPASRALVGARQDEAQAEGLPMHKAPAWTYVTHRLSSVSSTEIRKRSH